MHNKGRLIVVEGLEGAGKTTAMSYIKHFLSTSISNLVVTREPGGTFLGEHLRELVKKTTSEPVHARSELLMMYASRVQLIENLIKPALKRGDWVLCDRFEASSYAYQGGGRGISIHELDDLSAFSLQGFEPDLTFFLNITAEKGLKRIQARKTTDRIEQESLDFFKRTAKAYADYFREKQNIQIIDANQPLPQVKKTILSYLTYFMKQHNACT
ncbi:MAG: dTMP kinase [Legionellaceae bacterium]|nr:dTMP kinase [Legionellaceae bacterium]HCA88953.1 dTMP kinase [Legionellales bacterium]|tara:strand:- start:2800 stop:3441 length:642 start_codon:yes stop_codon:yes gene_type:complete